MNSSNRLELAVASFIFGIAVGVVVALIVLVISALIPGVELAAGKWGLIAGILAGIGHFVSRGGLRA